MITWLQFRQFNSIMSHAETVYPGTNCKTLNSALKTCTVIFFIARIAVNR